MNRPRLDEPLDPAEYVVHLPLPSALRWDRAGRVALLDGVEWLLLVGSPERARKVADAAREQRGADVGCYVDLTVPGRDETGREIALYVIALPGGPRIAVASHGIGLSGVELCLSEIPALLAVATGGHARPLRGVIRAGTRGTLAPVPLGCVALSTACLDDGLDEVRPDPGLTETVRAAARARAMSVIPDAAIDAHDRDGWPAPAPRLLVEGPGIATRFFWEGQGRPLYIPGEGGRRVPSDPQDTARRAALLDGWVGRGIRWIEMEDYTVHRIAARCGYPSASLGAVIARRRRPDGTYQVDYDHAAHRAAEMIPTDLALDAFALAHQATATSSDRSP